MADEKRKTTAAADLHPRPITPAHEPQDSGSDDTETATGPQRVGTHELSENLLNTSAAGLFNGSSNIDVHGGQFNQTMGHHTSVIINVNQHRRDENSVPVTSTGTIPVALLAPNYSTISPYAITDDGATVSIAEQPSERISTSRMLISVGNGNQIYEQHLQTKQRGFPLWIPEPNQRLPVSYRRKGVSIGDVGIITPSGGFSFLFNVCLPGGHPINPRILPEGFSPIYPPIDEDDIRQFPEFKPGSYVASSSVEESHRDANTKGMIFQTSASEAAILTMPDGAIAQDLENITRFRAYAAINIENWYRYANGIKGREAKNGDIRLVIGWDKASSWGMAALTNMTQERVCYLKFKPVEDLSTHPSVPPYTWEYSGMADVRVGPNSDDVEEFRRHDSDPGAKYTNQCLFIRTLNPTLDEDTWNSLNQELALSLLQEFPGYRHPAPGKASSNPGQSSTSQMQANSQSFSTTRGSPSANEVIDQSDVIGQAIRDFGTVSIDPDVHGSHPSDELNKVLLELAPTARVAITRDQDWFSFVNESSVIPNAAQLRERIKSDYSIICEEGVAYLEPKTFDNRASTPPRASSGRRPVLATTSMSVSKVPADSRGRRNVSLRQRSLISYTAARTPSLPTTPVETLRKETSFLVPHSLREELISSASSSSESSDESSDGLGPITDSMVMPDEDFTDYLTDESEAELQRQAEARAAVLAQNQAEELEFKLARQQLASVGLKPPKSWNPNATPPRTSEGAGAARTRTPGAATAILQSRQDPRV